jgi:uncharacterized membrane protein
MNSKEKLKFTFFDWTLEILSLGFLVTIIVLPFIVADYSNISGPIPIHFNIYGQPDNYAGKWSLWLFPGIGIFIYLMLTFLNRYPNVFNFPVEKTEQNKKRLYYLATRLVRFLKLVTLVMGCYITFHILRALSTGINNLNMIAMIGFILFYMIAPLVAILLMRNAK